MENFGTWRDAEGRLARSVNDFDEAATLPYTNDLVRLATSAFLASEAASLRASTKDLAGAFLDAYTTRLRKSGRPIVLTERNARIGESILRDLVRPRSFWKKKMADLDAATRKVPSACRNALDRALPPIEEPALIERILAHLTQRAAEEQRDPPFASRAPPQPSLL